MKEKTVDEKERKAKVRAMRKHLLALLRDGLNEGRSLDVLGCRIAESGANMVDEANGRTAYAVEPFSSVRSVGALRSTTRKVRKALGYTYP